MKALAVMPGQPGSMHLRDVPMPSLHEVPDGRGVLVRVLRVGVDGTDKEINAAEYGQAPEGHDYLITGHENFGQVVEVGRNVPNTIRPGTSSSRGIGTSRRCIVLGLPGITATAFIVARSLPAGPSLEV